jgi:hypothetical protein
MSRPALTLGLLLAACGGGAQLAAPPAHEQGGDVIVEEGAVHPTYAKAALDRALIDERGKEATAEHAVAELEAKGEADAVVDERLLVARADLAVRRRFIGCLEACQAHGQQCPPRLDDPAWKFDVDGDGATPTLDAPVRFDLTSWRAVAAELHGRACACRTMACVDGIDVAINQLEVKPMVEVQGDEEASASVTAARSCLYRLRGLAVAPPRRALTE